MEIKNYYPWLEDTLKQLAEHDCESICMVALSGDLSLTTYWQCNVADKYEMAAAIHSDIVLDIVRNNIHIIKDALEEAEDEQQEETE